MTTAAPGSATPIEAGLDESRRTLFKNASSLFAGQAVGLVVPLLTIPYLARVLGPAAWGPVLAAQALGYWLLLVFEFGFELSGTRAVARARAGAEAMSEVVHGVQSAKALLVVGAAPLVAAIIILVPSLRHNAELIGWAFAFAVLRGLSPLWFFQGIERVHGAVAVDTVTRALAALAVFAVVRDPSDGWRVIALQALFAAVALVVLTRGLNRHVRLRRPEFGAARRTLREGSSIFACRAWSGVYIQANAFVLSLLAGPAVVAFFGAAERIVRGAINLLQPLTQAFVPRVSFLHASDQSAARRTVRHALLAVGLFGAAIGLVAVVAAPLLVHVLLGSGYLAAIPVLRLLGALPLLIAVNTVMGLYWAIPFGHERLLLGAIVAAGVANVAAAIVLVPHWGAAGMAVSAIIAEVVVFCVLGSRYVQRGA
ncbi:MAG TPA: oligosaccharide flippase family protein [Gemmatimonadaceae bacterium]|nr:oligosaccharide flippase family protein [Gemmatimonadaceae bacterium]